MCWDLGTAVRARYSRKLGDFIIYYCLGQPPAEWIGGVYHPPSAAVYIRCRSFRQRYWGLLRGQPPADAAYRYLSPLHAFHSALCTLHSVLCTLYSAFCTLYSVLCTLHSVLRPLSFVLCPLSSILSSRFA